MAVAVPSRPYARTFGSLDDFAVRLDEFHLADEAAPGTSVDVRGWIIDMQSEPVEAAWIDVAGMTVPVTFNRERVDVARAHAMKDRTGSGVGFAALIDLPAEIPTGIHDVRVIAKTAQGIGVYSHAARRVRIAQPRIAPRSLSPNPTQRAFTLRIGDTQAAPHTLGRGGQTIRQESSLRVSGRVDGAAALHVIAEPWGRAAVGWDVPCDSDGRFDATLWTGGLGRGLFRLTIASVEDGAVSPVAWCEIAIAGPHHLPPLHLGMLRTPPAGSVLHFADASPRAIPTARDQFVAGQPIGVSGWCLDPVAHLPPLAVYFQVDDARPVPLSHHLPDPREGIAERQACGFGGLIDTTRYEAGTHRMRLLGAAPSGTGWYVIDDREIELADHRAVTAAVP